MAAALRPDSALRYTFVMRYAGRTPDLKCFACGCVLRSNAEVDEGAGRHTCTAKPGRHLPACGAVYWLVAGVQWPWGAGGVFVARTTRSELSRLDAAGYSVEQKVQHFLHSPLPAEAR